MSKSYKIGFGVLLVLLLGLVYLEANENLGVNWFESYNKADKIPYGSFVLYQELSNNPDVELTNINLPPYEYLNEDSPNGTYLFLNNGIYFDDVELDKILNWVDKGNTLFVISNSVSSSLLDTLNLSTSSLLEYDDFKQQPLLDFTNTNLKQDSAYHFQRYAPLRIFDEIDTLRTKVLGLAQYHDDKLIVEKPEVNFIETPFGKGKVILHLFPQAFTNYFILYKNNKTYAESALSYIDTSRPIYWDGHYKSGQTFQTSLLYVLFSNKYFKWAYYMVLITTLLFVVFKGKRKQRAIKVLEPLTNKTYDYTKTIAGMYLTKKDHNGIIKKQIALFMEFIRTEYRLQTDKLDDSFYIQLSTRSDNSFETTKELFNFLKQQEASLKPSKQDVLNLHKRIETYKNS